MPVHSNSGGFCNAVAQRVVQHGKHILPVDDEKYELSVSLFKRNVNRDEVRRTSKTNHTFFQAVIPSLYFLCLLANLKFYMGVTE